MRPLTPALLVIAILPACASSAKRPDLETLRQQVIATERAFARTMAARDFAAFQSFVSEEAVFLGGRTPLRGKRQVADGWKPLFAKPAAPFSWEPETVQVLESGALAFSSGPVRDADGKVVETFTSIWRLEAPGVWRIVFDTGNEVCPKP